MIPNPHNTAHRLWDHTLENEMAVVAGATRRLAQNRVRRRCAIRTSVPVPVPNLNLPVSIRSRLLSSTGGESEKDLDDIVNNFVVHRRADADHGSREYLLLPPDATIQDFTDDPSIKAAALLSHRNIVFGARSFTRHPIQLICTPLVQEAIKDAGENGEQPQAIASLAGLSDWVQKSLVSGESESLKRLQSEDLASHEAVRSIATGVPRKGHSVVGVGTYRDAQSGWKAVAEEFAEKGHADEVNLYRQVGARLVGIEHLADKNPDYLKSAGGAMARLFFL